MEKRLKAYLTKMEQLDGESLDKKKRKQIRGDMLVQIEFFQHERLVHLIVTVTFAVLTMLSILGCLLIPQVPVFILTVLLLALLIPYIRHYYILENGVQKLYQYYDAVTKEGGEAEIQD